MRHGEIAKGRDTQSNTTGMSNRHGANQDFVLEKSIFNNVFEKDIRRIFIYKKAERLAKALHLITPAFGDAPSLRDRFDGSALALVDAAVCAPSVARSALSRELLTLSSMLAIARTSGLLSPMNTDLIANEVQSLLQEIAGYEEPRLFLDEAPSLSSIAKDVQKQSAKEAREKRPRQTTSTKSVTPQARTKPATSYKGHSSVIKDNQSSSLKGRQATIMSVIRNKGKVSIKDISTLIRNVSEKTIQRELATLIASGKVLKEGERRWSTYSLAE